MPPPTDQVPVQDSAPEMQVPNFAQVYRDYSSFVFRTMRYLNVNSDQAEDAVQDAFIVVHRQLPGFEGRSTLRTWLYGITMRVALDYKRRKKHAPAGEEMKSDVRDSGAPSPLDHAAKNQAKQTLMALLTELGDDQRMVFVMTELEEFTAPEIAQALDIKVNTVYSRLRLARAAFNKSVARLKARQERGTP